MLTAGEVLIDRQRLARRVAELGAEISRDHAGQQPLLVGILKGGAMFMMDLIRAMDLPLTIDFMALSSYGSSTQSSGVVRILKDLDKPIEGQAVVLVEDIVDSGLTLRYLTDLLRRRNPASLKICALLVKDQARQQAVPVDYVGFKLGSEFVVGYGLDYDELYRNLPYIAVLR